MAQIFDEDKKSEIVVAVRPVYTRMRSESNTLKRFRDDEDETSSQTSSVISLEDTESQRQWYRRGASKPWISRISWCSLRRRREETEAQRKARRKRCCRWTGTVIVILTAFGVTAGIVYISFVTALLRRLAPSPGHSGVQHIVETWKEPNADGAFKFDWRDDFSRDVVPKNCHSHNDYWRSVPLYAALAAGCVSFEADIWLTEDEELLVSHSWKSTNRDRTLKSLYLDPLTNILENRNVTTADAEEKQVGVFETDPSATTVLLIDFKNDDAATWPVLLRQLAPLREKKWLTYYDGETLHQGPLTIVGTGRTPFDLLLADDTDRYIFYDAPLLSLSDDKYNSTNSYYASAPLKGAVGNMWLNTLSSSQISAIEKQVEAAEEKGLKSRYWDTPAWPIGRRDEIWRQLMRAGVGMLNVDDVVSATRWNWGWCVVAGIALCGSS